MRVVKYVHAHVRLCMPVLYLSCSPPLLYRAPVFTTDEWTQLDGYTKAISGVGLALITALLGLMGASRKWRQQPLVLSFVVSSAVVTLWMLIGTGGGIELASTRLGSLDIS